MERFEIPCACSATLPVVAGQAGERVRCPSCGAELRVPRLGELRRLGGVSATPPRAGRVGGRSDPPARSGWSVGHACMLAGCLVAAAAMLAAMRFGSGAGPGSVDESAIHAMVEATDFGTVLRAWKAFEEMGLQRGPPDLERRFQTTATISRLLWAVAGAGALLAAGGGALLLAGGPRSGTAT